MYDKDNPFTSDFDNPLYVAGKLLRLFAISFSFYILLKILFKKKESKPCEYMKH